MNLLGIAGIVLFVIGVYKLVALFLGSIGALIVVGVGLVFLAAWADKK